MSALDETATRSASSPALPERPWFERLNLLNATLLIFLLLVISSGIRIEGSERDLSIWKNLGSWDRFATVLLCILVVVTLLDFLSERVRRRIARRQTAQNPS
ncbi:MAG: hypothetical protein ACLFU4_08825 [Opitutales bacterium]